MPLAETIGIESHVTAVQAPYGPAPSISTRFRIIDAAGMNAGDWLNVTVVARIYDAATIQRTGVVPETPLAEGRGAVSIARADWTTINVPLPPQVRGRYSVAAKIYSADARYRRPFEPSHCFLALTTYGHFVRVPLRTLHDIYSGVHFSNSLAVAEIRQLVRRQVVTTEHGGVMMHAYEDQSGQLHLQPLHRSTATTGVSA